MSNARLQWYWYGYFVLLLSAGLVQMLRKILTDTGGFPSRYSAIIVAVWLIAALCAKARGIRLWKAWPWQALYYVLATMICVGLLYAAYLLLSGVIPSAALLLAAIALLLPATQQLRHYAFRSPDIWRETKTNESPA